MSESSEGGGQGLNKNNLSRREFLQLVTGMAAENLTGEKAPPFAPYPEGIRPITQVTATFENGIYRLTDNYHNLNTPDKDYSAGRPRPHLKLAFGGNALVTGIRMHDNDPTGEGEQRFISHFQAPGIDVNKLAVVMQRTSENGSGRVWLENGGEFWSDGTKVVFIPTKDGGYEGHHTDYVFVNKGTYDRNSQTGQVDIKPENYAQLPASAIDFYSAATKISKSKKDSPKKWTRIRVIPQKLIA